MKPRLYLDTSVFGGLFDEEFEDFTRPLFERLQNGEFTLLYSTVTQEELNSAPLMIQEAVKKIKSGNTVFLEPDSEAVELATQYINERVVGQTSFTDCLHIALATINHADYLVSWNFKHIVNIQRIRGYNSINIKNGYKELEIRSPRDFMIYEEDS
jgi:predicted nucleic acid-binding protein